MMHEYGSSIRLSQAVPLFRKHTVMWRGGTLSGSRRWGLLPRSTTFFQFPALHLHPLKGERAGQYAVTLAGRWRLIVTISEGDAGIHPGEILAEDLEARGMSQRELARRMERPLQTVSEIENGKKRITAATALDLEKALGISAGTWINLQGQYDLAKEAAARRKAG